VHITLYNQQKKIRVSKVFIKKVVLTTLEDFITPCSEVVVHLVSKKKICDLHQQFFNDPSPTDCISFPLEDLDCLGEIFVCPEVAIEYAHQNQKEPLHEIALYIIHGLLHLLGYDDLTKETIRIMRRLEKRAMQKLGLNV